MKANDIRRQFLEFFKEKNHHIVASAPIVLKNDPSLLFTNAGMNQFKDYFLGTKEAKYPRIADTQKCMRVSGKHNDLEEVGVDTYHHTMFEMLGNWSFGNYFKKEAIQWAWELLTERYGIDKDILYVTIFKGDKDDNLAEDTEAYQLWADLVPENRIIKADKKDNFWEMGETGPCGSCSEIHADIRPLAERNKVSGRELVNKDHPEVIEIWNLVFIEFNRMANGSLMPLPEKHVDTGMGFERLCMVLQGVRSNYDTDIFQPIIQQISQLTGKTYGKNTPTDIAMRVIADHLRAVSFSIADGQLPANTGAGYVIRRILRRAVRYAYSSLDYKQPLLFQLVPILVEQMKETFPELKDQQALIQRVIQEEESNFLRTLAAGIKKMQQIQERLAAQNKKIIPGEEAFELLDTFGFPIDLSRLMATEQGLQIDEKGFKKAMQAQKERARAATKVATGDWSILKNEANTTFVGYDELSTTTELARYRAIETKGGKKQYQLVLSQTPFYAESGGQVGDTGYLQFGDEKISVVNTKKENDLTVHIVNKLPQTSNLNQPITAVVAEQRRHLTENNHSATHLLHAALRQVLGDHVQQRGSLVHPDYLRFDFSHFKKVTDDEMREIELLTNKKITENIALQENRNMPISDAKAMGAMALFGEKYGDRVRVVIFDKNYSVELCGGTHVNNTGQIGLLKITNETAVAAGIRRIEALTGPTAFKHLYEQSEQLKAVKNMLKSPKNVLASLESTLTENQQLRKTIDQLQAEKANRLAKELQNKVQQLPNGIAFLGAQLDVNNNDTLKQIAFDLKNAVPNLFLVIGAAINGKASLSIMVAETLTTTHNLHAGKLIKSLAKHIQGGGGGQAFYATAGGKNANGLGQAIAEAKEIAEKLNT